MRARAQALYKYAWYTRQKGCVRGWWRPPRGDRQSDRQKDGFRAYEYLGELSVLLSALDDSCNNIALSWRIAGSVRARVCGIYGIEFVEDINEVAKELRGGARYDLLVCFDSYGYAWVI